MPQLTTSTRKKSNDRVSPSLATSSKIDLGQLDLDTVGVDSPELILNRARYQTVRENALTQQTRATVGQAAGRQAVPPPQNNPSAAIDRPKEEAIDPFDAESNNSSVNNTPEQTSSTQSDSATSEKKKYRDQQKDKESPAKKEDEKSASKEPIKESQPNSGGGGVEKKDPGVTPQPLTKNEGPAPKQESSTDSDSASPADKLNQAKSQAAVNLKNAQDKLKSGDIGGAVEGVTAAGKVASAWALTTMWGAVWLDWTLLTLLGLNVYFIVSNFTDKIASFGEDYLFGKWMPKELAKWFEIILMVLIDMIVLSVFFMILYGGYKFYTMSFTKTFFGLITGGKEGAIKANLDY